MAGQPCVTNNDIIDCESSYKMHSLFDADAFRTLTKGIRVADCLRSKFSDDFVFDRNCEKVLSRIQDLAVSETLSCSYCCVNFENQSQQRLHYKLDWHRYNLKQNLEGKKPVLEEKFDQLADDVSSISASDSEEDEINSNALPFKEDPIILKTVNSGSNSTPMSDLNLRQPKLFFENEDGNIISLFKCVLFGKKDMPEKEKHLVSLALECQTNPKWAVVMVGGGHFAASIFEGEVPVLHKTFHSYTVRASQGGTQGSRDSKSSTSHPKSAGASLRRYNEASLVQHVQEILQSWTEQFAKCSRIFWRAAGPHNQSIIFGGKSPPLSKYDLRLRSIPFPTRRPTFFEVKRVHKALSSLEIYGRAENYVDKFPVSPRSQSGRKKPCVVSNDGNESKEIKEPSQALVPEVTSPKKASSGRVIDRAKPRRSPSRPLPEMVQALAVESAESSGNEAVEFEIVVPTLETFEEKDLKEWEDTVPASAKQSVAEKKRPKGGKKKKEPTPPVCKQMVEKDPILDNSMFSLAKEIREIIESGDVDLLNLHITASNRQQEDPVSNGVQGCESERNEANGNVMQKIQRYIFEDGFSILHAASSHGNPEVVRALLEAGFDPAINNKKGQSPYAVSANKETRNTFRRFMADYPDRYDYTKAQVPGPLTEELERALEAKAIEKRKLARKAKKEKEKQRKKEEEERTERERFLNLSEREKRALAAERRIQELSRKGQGKPIVIFRCYQCAVDITGKVPFEYEAYRFCTMECLKKHRAKSKPTS